MPIYKQKEKKDGLNKYLVRINYTDSYGKHKQLTRTAYGIDNARELERQLEKQVKEKTVIADMTVGELMTDFFETVKHTVRATTMRGYYTNNTHHIQPYLADVKLEKLNTKILTEWKNKINEKGLSVVTRRNIYADLRAALNHAVKMEYIPTNPLDKVDNFKDAYHQEKTIDFYTPEEFLLFAQSALENAVITGYYDYYIFFMIAYYTGARKGEIHALRWNCIDNDKLQIKRSISQKIKGDDVETPPKNKSSIRTIAMPQPLINALNEHKARQQQTNPKWKDTAFICGFSRPLRDTSIEKENQKYAEQANIKKIRIHDFRHSHASLLINNNINPLEVAHRLGHSTVDQTLKTYAHLFPNEELKTIEILNKIV